MFVQEFGHWVVAGQLGWAARANSYIHARAASAQLQEQCAAHSLSQHTKFHPNMVNEESQRCLLRASCGHVQCFRVVSRGAVRRSMQQNRDCLKCPAHDNTRWSYSKWVLKFFNLLQATQYQGIVIYDWCDVPTNSHMHWDATVFQWGLAHRIELDGPTHDLVHSCRLVDDLEKDRIVCEDASRSLLRLSYHDADAWHLCLSKYVQARVQGSIEGVWGSRWYEDFQGEGYGRLNVITD